LQKDPLAVKVSQLSSIKTQLPYSYYSLPFCRPDAVVDSAENLGELLRGDRIENTPYVVSTHHSFTPALLLSLMP
jgi:transmembrane 9 superfamily protein 2/4